MSSGMRGRGRGTAILVRLAIAALLGLVAIVGYYANSQRNPTTGEVQQVKLSVKDEIVLGLQAAPQMIAEHNGLDPDVADQQRVARIGVELTAALKDSYQNPYEFDFHLLNDNQTINAFALPGGQVFITSALYDRLETDGQLAGVLGHEIGHVIERHGSQRLAKADLTQGLVGAAGVAGGGRDSAAMAAAIGNLLNMRYGRGDELESDEWGVKLTAAAGYSPEAMYRVMQILDEASQGGQPEFMSTHPKPANRIEYIADVIAREFPNGLPPGLKP